MRHYTAHSLASAKEARYNHGLILETARELSPRPPP
jgi:hypothetical protein